MPSRPRLHFLFALLALCHFIPAQANGQVGYSRLGTPHTKAVSLASSLPLVVIDTEGAFIPDEPKILAQMGIIDNGEGVENNVNDPFNHFDGIIGIERRGSSSQFFPKLSYAVELRDANGLDVDAALLGMPAEEDWVLNGPFSDKSLMRNVLVYHLANRMGRYAPRTRFVELILNGEHQGVYVLMERIKRDKERVDISTLNPEEITGDDLTGGYIVKIDKSSGQEVDGWLSPHPPKPGYTQQIFYQYHYPKPSEIVPEQAAYIQQVIADYEDTMAGVNFADPEIGYARHIDVDSAIDFYLLNEISRNVDGYRLSTFLHKDKDSQGGKLVFGPIWDFNLGFGNADYYNGSSQAGFQAVIGVPVEDFFQPPFWWAKLWQEPVFNARAAQRWHTLRKGLLHTDSLMQFIDTQVALLGDAPARNFATWNILGTYVWPNAYIGNSYDDEVNYLKNWLTQRLAWMDANLEEISDLSIPELPAGTFEMSRLYPNPAQNEFNITLQTDFTQPFRIEMFDMMGRQVLPPHEELLESNTPMTYTIPRGNLAAGVYILRVQGASEEITKKLVLR